MVKKLLMGLFMAAILATAGVARADVISLVYAEPPVNVGAWVESLEGCGLSAFRSSAAGSLVWVVSETEPPVLPGMKVLAHRYSEVAADADKRSIYNFIVPPNADGTIRPFAYFAGREGEME